VTNAKCSICDGVGVNPNPHPHKCGACNGSGLSTAPWDQDRMSSIITVRSDEAVHERYAIEKTWDVFERGEIVAKRHLVTWKNI